MKESLEKNKFEILPSNAHLNFYPISRRLERDSPSNGAFQPRKIINKEAQGAGNLFPVLLGFFLSLQGGRFNGLGEELP